MIGLCGMVSLGRTETVYMYCVSRAYPSRATKIVLRSAHKRAQKPTIIQRYFYRGSTAIETMTNCEESQW